MAYPAKTDRSAILAAAMNKLETHGLAGLSIRAVASELDLAPNALYRYFSDRLQLESAMGNEAAGRLHAFLYRAVRRVKQDPFTIIRTLARAYLRFAREQRPVYDMMMSARPASEDRGAGRDGLWLFTLEHVTPIAGERHAREAAIALWAFLHGMAVLEAGGALGGEKPKSSFDYGLDAWLEGAIKAAAPTP